MQVEPPPNVVRFGTFELDLLARELHKNGLKIHLPEQSIQILAMLLDRPDEVIGRELGVDAVVEGSVYLRPRPDKRSGTPGRRGAGDR
jgi:DNA-binding winged helix-turn-helix (wHTH) protein